MMTYVINVTCFGLKKLLKNIIYLLLKIAYAFVLSADNKKSGFFSEIAVYSLTNENL